MNNKKISVIVPIYNELKSIEQFLIRLSDSLAKLEFPYEIIFVDDNSTDGTYEYLSRFRKSNKIILHKKQGKSGKAFSLLEGFKLASGSIIAMIDSDLQYPPEEIPSMVEALEKSDIVVANRKVYKGPVLRKIASRGFRLFFGKLLFGLNHDIQAGLKVFTKEVADTIIVTPKSGWTFDLEFLHKAREAGFVIANHDIPFAYRKNGTSKVGLVKTTWEIGTQALSLKLKKSQPQIIPAKQKASMIGAGIGYKKRKYITHTTLSHKVSAITTLHASQKFFIGILLITLTTGFLYQPLATAIVLVAILSVVYFIDVLFNLYIIVKSLRVPQEITSTDPEIAALGDNKLPTYSILCPLYKEAHVIPQFLDAISKIDWPKDKLDVMLLLEEDDKESLEDVSKMTLPAYVRSIIVPHSIPKTKPKACNYGLGMAKGEYLVIYDAEDIPDSKQLKKAYLAFQKVKKDVVCLQAKLNYYNPNHNLLTRFFTAEYSLWFDVALTGLQSINTSIPLGGTSNHFKTQDLKKLQGWDPFNVTEDADLGIRLFKQGYKTAMIDSTTLEEANSNLKNWMRQRSRWLKGYIQTYLVHMREILTFTRKKGIHAFIFQLVIGGKIAFILINPLLWLATFSYFALYSIVGPTIESIYPTVIFYMAAFSLIFGNFLFLYYYMIGCIKRGHYGLVKYVFLIPVYWFMISFACVIAVYQLIFKPHYWEKTIHGFHLKKRKVMAEITVEAIEETQKINFPNPFRQRLVRLINLRKIYFGGISLVSASVIGNVLNLLFNAYLGRTLDLASFGLVSLVSSFVYLSFIPFSALTASVNYRSGFLDTRHGEKASFVFWQWIRRKSFLISIVACGLWVAVSPFLMNFFNVTILSPFILFAVVWLVGFIAATDRGFLSGKLMFGSLAVITVVEPISKLATAFVFVQTQFSEIVYSAIPISIVISFIATVIFVSKRKKEKPVLSEKTYGFPKKFFSSSVLSGLSTIAFLSLDIILAKHYLSPDDAGRYALISTVGKMIYFLGGLASQFTIPLISRSEGAKNNSDKTFSKILLSTYFLAVVGFLSFGVFGYISVPIIFLERGESIVQYLPIFAFAMLLFTVSKVFVTYYQTKNIYSFSIFTFLLAIVQVVLISLNHGSIQSIVLAMLLTGALNFTTMVLLHLRINWVKIFENNINDLLNLLFEKSARQKSVEENLRILIFNWRDLSHVWSGGAELYIHKLARHWVKDGNQVTIFCGNDSKSPRNQSIDGIQIIRRGGSYTVYLWAFLYYILRFRGKFDVIIDCENGIPFFTPLYARIPVFLHIHHIHQEVFREHLVFPLSAIARFMEAKIMPLVYRNNPVITVSESSKNEILKIGLSKLGNIAIVKPGIDLKMFKRMEKTPKPTFAYLGRLKSYKNIDIAIKAFARISKTYDNARLKIAGFGDNMAKLKKLTQELKLENKIEFLGLVTDKEKAKLLSQSWGVLQPSMIEGWGITVIEANASGTPVIASNVAGLRDSVADRITGVLVEVNNVEAFSSAMVDFITDKSYRELLSKRAYVWAQDFSWEKSANQFFQILSSNLTSKRQFFSIKNIAIAKNERFAK